MAEIKDEGSYVDTTISELTTPVEVHLKVTVHKLLGYGLLAEKILPVESIANYISAQFGPVWVFIVNAPLQNVDGNIKLFIFPLYYP